MKDVLLRMGEVAAKSKAGFYQACFQDRELR